VAERDHVRTAAAEIPGLVGRIGTVFAARTGKADAGPSLDALVDFSREVLRHLPEPAAEPLPVPVDDPVPPAAEPNGQAGEPVPSPATVGSPAAPRQGVDGREDVLRLLDQVLDYYRRREPSSPVPLLLQRARRLVPMSFVEAMRELAPSGVDELVRVAGHLEDSVT
jgi:type VI secretion system protein ImpA